ncbi:hypothetical protein YC2023_026174 [Brassica napus]
MNMFMSYVGNRETIRVTISVRVKRRKTHRHLTISRPLTRIATSRRDYARNPLEQRDYKRLQVILLRMAKETTL